MKKRTLSHEQTLKIGFVVVAFILFSAFFYTFYSEPIGMASKYLKMKISLPKTPTAQPAPPTPTPVPQPRITTGETAQKSSFPAEIAYWLQPGKLTTPSDALKQVKIQPISPGQTKEGRTPVPPDIDAPEFNIIRGILSYVKSFNKFKEDPNCANCFNRDVNSVFVNGISRSAEGGNCGHYALLFITLARSYNVPAKSIDIYFTAWANEEKSRGCWSGQTKGHNYAQVYVNGTWYGVDPTGGAFVKMDERGNVLDYSGAISAKAFAQGRDDSDFMQFLERWCLESYRYNLALNGLPLCENAQYKPTFEQMQMIQTCKEPIGYSQYKS